MVDFLDAVPLPDKIDGVKLGESTLNRFILLLRGVLVNRRSVRSEFMVELPVRLVCSIDFLRVMIKSTT